MDKNSFLARRRQFQLGKLTTESRHPITKNLSFLCQQNALDAIALLQDVDRQCLSALEKYLPQIYRLHVDIKKQLQSGARIFLCGCGATGRLSVALESFWRMYSQDQSLKERIVAFMAGGDFALIKSVEKFEDHAEYGDRQLRELGFGEEDLLIAITEGGETSFVIGAANTATMISRVRPYFLYCNPDEQLHLIERSRSVLENNSINKLNLTVGPMALAGSTRMQASTAQMLALALALFVEADDRKDFLKLAKAEIHALKQMDLSSLAPIIEDEALQYRHGRLVTYVSDIVSSISVLTDTTERAPTFSLMPFESAQDNETPSWCYLAIENTSSSRHAWESMLVRPVRGLDWAELDRDISMRAIERFDISQSAVKRRSEYKGHQEIHISQNLKAFVLRSKSASASVLKPSSIEALNQIGLKMLLNIISTVVMGKLGRYDGNLMTYVRCSNFKLIDRAIRYILELATDRGVSLEYDEVVNHLFAELENKQDQGPIVMRTLLRILKSNEGN